MTAHPVFHADGEPGFMLRLVDDGVTLADGKLIWRVRGAPVERALADLRQVRLWVIPAGRFGRAGRAALTFRDGRVLSVFGTDAYGRVSRDHAFAYRAFMRDLHRQAGALPDVRFMAGRTAEGGALPRSTWLLLAAIIAGAGLFLAAKGGGPAVGGLAVLVAGIAVWFGPMLATNSAGSYNPRAIPDALLP
jgi:hypothetical protein